jgi:hypothetical protein
MLLHKSTVSRRKARPRQSRAYWEAETLESPRTLLVKSEAPFRGGLPGQHAACRCASAASSLTAHGPAQQTMHYRHSNTQTHARARTHTNNHQVRGLQGAVCSGSIT